jgi:hypothetical protein
MALEDKIDLLIAAIEKNTKVTESLMNLRAASIEEIKQAAASTSTKKTAPKSETKSETKTDEKPKDSANISKTPEDRKDPGDDRASKKEYVELAEVIRGFVGMDDNAELREERAALVKKIFDHDQIKAETYLDVPEAMIPSVVKTIEGKTPEYKAKSDAQSSGGGVDLGV